MRKRILLLLPLLLIGNFILRAQEYPVYNQYYFNYYLVNPALAGANECSYFMLTHAQNWIGIEDAPYTTSLSFQTRLKNNFGIGAYFYNDKNGFSTQQGGQVTAAYHIDMTPGKRSTRSIRRDRQLSFAVSLKLFNYGFDDEIGDIYHNSGWYDPAMEDLGAATTINANFGAYFTSYGFFTGLSLTNLTKTKMASYDENSEPDLPITGNFIIGNEFQVTQSETLEPSLMYMFDANGSMAMDLNLRYAREASKDDFSWWAQLTLRQSINKGSYIDKLTLADNKGGYQVLTLKPMVGFQIDKFHIAYCFGANLNRMVRYSAGTHELMIGYTLCHTSKFCR
ncbi:MAG: type IX secretion system membrane protein PorP/SprF [Prevotellaceae bacterium]|jgi:type IX secretion system PorP/SprF family membrane protein|nr:type IX secretion system membrane protein PorP/SprF [Prevotellaceae bacterium]